VENSDPTLIGKAIGAYQQTATLDVEIELDALIAIGFKKDRGGKYE
jgi:hypothetical protein